VYDDKGNETEWNSYKPDGSLDVKETYKYDYDETGNWIKETKFRNGNPEIIIEREIKYDKTK
jgi:hypothetical protein